MISKTCDITQNIKLVCRTNLARVIPTSFFWYSFTESTKLGLCLSASRSRAAGSCPWSVAPGGRWLWTEKREGQPGSGPEKTQLRGTEAPCSLWSSPRISSCGGVFWVLAEFLLTGAVTALGKSAVGSPHTMFTHQGYQGGCQLQSHPLGLVTRPTLTRGCNIHSLDFPVPSGYRDT